jgi:protein-S-isoprenylcysteine O-methyltransferase Ste14
MRCEIAASCYSSSMGESRDNPGVIAPPPLIALATLLLGLAIDWLLPIYVTATLLGSWWRGFLGGLLVATGLAIGIAGRQRFVEAGTNVNPWKPSVRLATAGIYQYVRNPMYTGMMVLVGGFGVAFASDWTLVLLVPMAFLLRNGVILREEAYLEAKFGEEYLAYKAKVARWGIW